MNQTQDNKNNDSIFDDEIDLRELFNALWKDRKLIILITTIFAIGSVVYALSLTNYYKSESLLTTRSNTSTQGLTQIGSVAAMAGLSVQSTSDDKASQTIELIQSRMFVRHLLTFENILPSIMAVKSYNTGSKKLLFDEDIYDPETKTWKIKSEDGQSVKPSYLKAHREYMQNIISISRDKLTGFIKIEVEHISPVFAKEFLDLIIREANEILRKKDMEESKQGLEYLASELTQTPFIEIKESINTLIEAQLEKQMMTQINKDYVLIRIEPPFIPDKKSRPVRSFICIVGTAFGGFLSLCIALIRHFYFGDE